MKDYWKRKRNRRYRREHAEVFKRYAKAASEMTREELEHAYVRVRFAHTSFFRLPENYYSDPFFNDDDDCQ